MTIKSACFLSLFVFIVSIQSQPPPDEKACFQGNKASADDCCVLPRFVAKEINTKCDEEFKPLSPRPPPGVQQKEGSCVTQCLFDMIGAFKGGKLLPNETRQALAKTIGRDANFKPLLNAAVDECYHDVMNNPSNVAKPVPLTAGREGCSFLPQAYMNCIKSHLFMNCPKGNWTGVDGCNLLKQKITAGCSYFSVMIGGKIPIKV